MVHLGLGRRRRPSMPPSSTNTPPPPTAATTSDGGCTRPPRAPWSASATTTSVTMTNEELGAKSKRRSNKHSKRSSAKQSHQNVDELDSASRVKRASCGLEMVDNDYLETADRADRTGGWNNLDQQQTPAVKHQTSTSSRFELWRKREERPRQRNSSCQQQQQQQQQRQQRHPSTSGISIANMDPETASQISKSKKQPSRFSLRRLFYGNSLLAQPFLPNPLGSSAAMTSSQRRNSSSKYRRRQKAANGGGTSVSSRDTEWKDNMSSGSGAALTTVGPDGRVMRECTLCLLALPIDRFPLLRNCHHLFCSECLRSYVRIEVQEGRANVRCPQCVETMHPNDVATFLGNDKTGQQLLRLYEQLSLRRLLATDPDTRWCPGPNCTYAVIATGCASCPKITCERPGCGHSFCYHCKAEWHPNQTCDAARAKRNPPSASSAFRASSASFGQESGTAGNGGTTSGSEVKVCPRCNVLIVKMDDGSCNHMTCAVCGAEFCWLCMKEISDLHYLSPSGCTFWGKKPWSRKKKLMWQLGTLVGAPVGIALLAGISVPAMIIGIPVWVSRKLHAQFRESTRLRRNSVIAVGVMASVLVSPFLAALAVSIGVPILLAYVYGVVPISLCRSEGCGVSTSAAGVKIDVDEEEMPYRRMVASTGDALSTHGGSQIGNPSIGEVSLGASLSLGSACHLEDKASSANISSREGLECDRESASVTAIAGTSRTVSLASSYVGGASAVIRPSQAAQNNHLRLEVGADVHGTTAAATRKKFSLSSERLEGGETISLGGRSTATAASLMSAGDRDNDGAASTRALAGSILAYRMTGGDSQSVHSYRANTPGGGIASSGAGACGGVSGGTASAGGGVSADEISLRSLPGSSVAGPSTYVASIVATSSNTQQRSLSPVSNMSGDELGQRRSSRRRPHLDKQLSENSSLLSAEDAVSERVRFDDNVSFIDEDAVCVNSANQGSNSGQETAKMLKSAKLDKSGVVVEETAEELARATALSPEPMLGQKNVTTLRLDGNQVSQDGDNSKSSETKVLLV